MMSTYVCALRRTCAFTVPESESASELNQPDGGREATERDSDALLIFNSGHIVIISGRVLRGIRKGYCRG
jgi:hypothetical protein